MLLHAFSPNIIVIVLAVGLINVSPFTETKVHYGADMSPTLNPVLSQINPFHTLTDYFCKIY
jgi:hypothetical protein